VLLFSSPNLKKSLRDFKRILKALLVKLNGYIEKSFPLEG